MREGYALLRFLSEGWKVISIPSGRADLDNPEGHAKLIAIANLEMSNWPSSRPLQIGTDVNVRCPITKFKI